MEDLFRYIAPAGPWNKADLLFVVAVLARQVWSDHLIGGAPPRIEAEFKRISKPRPGDAVFMLYAPGSLQHQIGFLILSREEGRSGLVHYIERAIDGGVTRWENCDVISLPLQGQQASEQLFTKHHTAIKKLEAEFRDQCQEGGTLINI